MFVPNFQPFPVESVRIKYEEGTPETVSVCVVKLVELNRPANVLFAESVAFAIRLLTLKVVAVVVLINVYVDCQFEDTGLTEV